MGDYVTCWSEENVVGPSQMIVTDNQHSHLLVTDTTASAHYYTLQGPRPILVDRSPLVFQVDFGQSITASNSYHTSGHSISNIQFIQVSFINFISPLDSSGDCEYVVCCSEATIAGVSQMVIGTASH